MKLVYLIFADNTAYCRVAEEAPKGVTVDLKAGTWEYAHEEFRRPRRIGESRYLGRFRRGVIGVYDLDNMTHVSAMVHAAVESQRDYSNAD